MRQPKQYFLALFPVDGEPGVGDIYFSKYKTEHKAYHCVHVTAMDDEYYYEGNIGYTKADVISKAEIRLCNRKFKEGDRITSEYSDKFYFTIATKEHVKNSYNVDNNNRYFTIIDKPISPLAAPFFKFDRDIEFNPEDVEIGDVIKLKCPWGCFH
jgi:hypothetical protein